MKLFKDYTQDFENLTGEIEDVKTYVRGKNDKTLIAINNIADEVKSLEKQYDLLASEIAEIKQLLFNQQVNGHLEEEIEIATKEPQFKKGEHISHFKNFENFKLQREYFPDEQVFKAKKNGIKIHLTFEQLVAIIKAHKNGLHPKKMNNPILKKIPEYSIKNYIYIWRAGGFNQAIKDYARMLGYNPNKLISREVEENV